MIHIVFQCPFDAIINVIFWVYLWVLPKFDWNWIKQSKNVIFISGFNSAIKVGFNRQNFMCSYNILKEFVPDDDIKEFMKNLIIIYPLVCFIGLLLIVHCGLRKQYSEAEARSFHKKKFHQCFPHILQEIN